MTNSFIVTGTTSQEVSFGSATATRVPKLIAGAGSSRYNKRAGERTPTKTLIQCLIELDVLEEEVVQSYFKKQVA